MKKHERFAQIWDGEWNDCSWRGNLDMCCGCSLVHRTSYRIKDGKLQEKVKIDTPRTYSARRRAGIKIVRTK